MLSDVDVRHQILTRSGADFSAVWPFSGPTFLALQTNTLGPLGGLLGPAWGLPGPPRRSWALLGHSGGLLEASWCFTPKPPTPPTYPTTYPPYLLACLPTCFLTAHLPTCFQYGGKLRGQVLILLPNLHRKVGRATSKPNVAKEHENTKDVLCQTCAYGVQLTRISVNNIHGYLLVCIYIYIYIHVYSHK